MIFTPKRAPAPAPAGIKLTVTGTGGGTGTFIGTGTGTGDLKKLWKRHRRWRFKSNRHRHRHRRFKKWQEWHRRMAVAPAPAPAITWQKRRWHFGVWSDLRPQTKISDPDPCGPSLSNQNQNCWPATTPVIFYTLTPEGSKQLDKMLPRHGQWYGHG